MPTLRERVYDILDYDNTAGPLELGVTAGLVALIIANAVAVVLASEPGLGEQYAPFFSAFEAFSVAVFSVEYVLRLWSITARPAYGSPLAGRLRYMATPYAIVDLLAVLPFYLPFLIPVDLRILRVLLLFKLGRYSTAFGFIDRVVRRKWGELFVAVFISLLLLVVVSSLMYGVEHEAQPEAFPSIVGTMYWSLVTLTTLGYGDVVPLTPLGRLLASVTAVIGVSLFGLPAGILASGFIEELQKKKDGDSACCPHCGKSLGDIEKGGDGDEAAPLLSSVPLSGERERI